jgi:phage recombination protein Bet
MSNIIPLEQQVPAFALPEDQLIKTLQASLYPGAHADSVQLVLGYCRAQRLDPMQKPVHIVPMKVKVGTKENGAGIFADRDTIMPGIGLYRSQASRSLQHVGTSDPEFGPMVKLEFSETYWENNTKRSRPASVEFPEWCKVTVRRRLVSGEIGEFTATEFWLENYATAGRDSTAPNAMWKKRPRGQLAKCAEAQALRKAFPELGAAPTAEEMEGKTFELDEPAGAPAREVNEFMPSPKRETVAIAAAIEVDPDTGEVRTGLGATPEEMIGPAARSKAPTTDGEVASAGMIATLRKTMERKGKSENDFAERFGVSLDQMPNAIRNEAMAWARA